MFLTGKGSTYAMKAGFTGACGRCFFFFLITVDVFNVDRART